MDSHPSDARDTLGLACRPGLGIGSLASLGMGLRHQVLGDFTLLVLRGFLPFKRGDSLKSGFWGQKPRGCSYRPQGRI